MDFGNLFRLAAVTVFATAAVSCAKEVLEEGVEPKSTGYAAEKIIGDEERSQGSSLLVYVKDATSQELEALVNECGAVSYVRLFPAYPGKEEKEKTFGLDNWYVLNFDEGVSLSSKALTVASSPRVRTVEYNCMMERCNVGKPRQFAASGCGPSRMGNSGNVDPLLKNQWHYGNDGNYSYDGKAVKEAYAGADINVKQAWKLCAGNPEVIVAVLDECVQWDHPDLAANIWNNPAASQKRGDYVNDVHGWNFVKNSSALNWQRLGNVGHGTHVAGTVAAVNNNGLGVAGVAGGSGNGDGVKLMICQIFDGTDGCNAAALARAFKYAADNGACIAQCSFGYDGGTYGSDDGYYKDNAVEVDAIRYFIGTSNCPQALEGGLVIAAAGNEGSSMSAYPAALKECISVTSFCIDGLPAYYTNYGPGSNIAAPGGEYYTGGQDRDCCTILSTLPTKALQEADEDGRPTGSYMPTNYGWMQGTSMACPHMSGVAALGVSYALKQGYHFTNEEFKSLLLTSVNDIDAHIGLAGTKQTLVGSRLGSLKLFPYKGKMGSGMADVWRLYMQMDGVPSLMAEVGQMQSLDVSGYFGGNSQNLTFTSVEALDDGIDALGLDDAPVMKYGKMVIAPSKPGCARFRISAVAGGTAASENGRPGGMEVSRIVSVIARPAVASNGGWL